MYLCRKKNNKHTYWLFYGFVESKSQVYIWAICYPLSYVWLVHLIIFICYLIFICSTKWLQLCLRVVNKKHMSGPEEVKRRFLFKNSRIIVISDFFCYHLVQFGAFAALEDHSGYLFRATYMKYVDYAFKWSQYPRGKLILCNLLGNILTSWYSTDECVYK